jgi:hypothetical protein
MLWVAHDFIGVAVRPTSGRVVVRYEWVRRAGSLSQIDGAPADRGLPDPDYSDVQPADLPYE